MKNALRYISVLILAATCCGQVYSQNNIDKEIVVVKPYQPSLSDAYKINILPNVSDSISIHPDFEYSIRPRKLDAHFQVRPITSARLVGKPLKKLYKSYLKLGFGNYLAPLGEININSLRNKKGRWGLSLKHYSVNGKLKMDNEQKVNPGYMENSGSLYGQKVFRKSYISGKIQGAYDRGDFYGYHSATPDPVPQGDEIKQTYLKFDGLARMGSSHADNRHLNYTASLVYNYTYDHYSNFEHATELELNFDKHTGSSGFVYELGAGAGYYYTSSSINPLNNTVITLEPAASKGGDEYEFKLGLDFAVDILGNDGKPYAYPDVSLQINMIEDVAVPYFGLDGGLQVNNFRRIAVENRYIMPGLKVSNTNNKIRAYAGVKGSLSKSLVYDIRGSYSMVDNMYFYLNDIRDNPGNRFDVVYDNLEKLELRGELRHRQVDKFSGLLSVAYNKYNLDALEHPWHMPELMVSFDEQYNLLNKILIDLGVIYTGKRYAAPAALDTEAINMKGFVDLNLGLEYRYTSILSGFIRFNNILGVRNQSWNQYPGMGFNVLFGFTYAL